MASRGVNKVTIIGLLGADPETRYLPSGAAVTNIRVATSEVWKDKDTGEQKEKTEWHSIGFFGKLAEIAGQYLKKGAKVYIEGKLQTRKWQDKDGNDRYSTEIVANEMQMLDRRGDGDNQGQPQLQSAPQQSRPAAPQPQMQRGAPPPIDDYDDSVPF